MLIIPAIDLQDGKCIRLLQGRKEEVTVYSDDPVSMAKHWAGHGAEMLHIVDIDGAFTGLQKNVDVIVQVRKAVDIPIQLGGGIRSIDRIERLVSFGIDRVIIGTAAAENGEMFREACARFKGKVAVGVDARDGKVAVKGWEELTGWDAVGFARHMEAEGASAVIYTDISRDGMLSGPNVDAMAVMVDALTVPVIASGGVSGIDDIRSLLTIDGLHGVITGKALYAGTLDLKEAIDTAKRH
jgi:phosphoribosylformimino-5-aminoimidazole carboxamide ribotide isomerase